MASYNELLALIDAYINRNGVQAITGQILNGVLKAMVDQLGRGYTLMGYAEPTGDPGTPDGPESWFASVPGTYTNYGEIQVAAGELALLSFAPSEGWTKNTIYEGFREVTADIDGNVGTPEVGVSYANGVLSFDFRNMKGNPGEDGDPAGFGAVTASVDDQVGTPSVSVSSSGPDTAKNFAFAFHNLKGETGVTSVLATVDNTSGNPQCSVSLQGGQLTLAFTGLKGAQGNTGSSVDYPFTIVNNLTTNDPAQALSAAMGVQLESEVSQLEAKVDGVITDKDITPTYTSGYMYSHGNGNVLLITANSSSRYSGTVTDTSTPPSNGIDVSPYVGKTIKITMPGRGASSDRLTAILGTDSLIKAEVKERNYTADGNNVSAELVVPADGKWLFWSATYNLTSIVVVNGETIVGLTDRVEDLEDAVVDLQGDVHDLQDAVEGVEGIADELSVVPSVSPNLLDPSKLIGGYYRNGQHYEDSNYVESDYMPVTPGSVYKLLNSTTVPHNYYRFVAFFNAQKEWMNGADITSVGTDFTAPAGSAFAKVSLYNDADYLTAYGVFLNSVTDYVPYYHYDVLSVVNDAPFDKKGNNSIVTKKDIPAGFGVTKDLKVVVAYPFATISEGSNNIVVATDYQQARIEDAGQTEYDSNPLFNFYSMLYNGVSQSNSYKDDIAPAHFLGQTLGANHGQPCKKATITGHGLDNTAIGTAWVQNDVNFYVMLIVDEDHIVFLSANRGTSTAPQWTALQAGTLTKGADTLTVESVSDYQIHPSIKNENLSIRVDGQTVTEDGTYYGNVIDFVESYEVMNPSSILDNIIARAGQSADPVFTGNGAVRIENIYRFVKGMSVLVISNFAPMQQMSFQDVMFSQAMLKGTNGQVKYYVPNSLPFGSYDLRQPLTMTWGSDVANMYCTSEYTKDTTKPINRVVQYGTGLGYAIGFLIDRGVGKSLFDYTHATFELRGGTGKIYPHGVDGATVGTTLQSGQVYGAVLYRCPFIPETSGNRLSMYHFRYEGGEYVFLDYKGSMNDRVVLDDSLNGKEITVLESQNATLLTDVYNGGFYVKATFVTNETCYLVAKIK